jgi:REP element-mobilizing transposase RayT
MSRPLRLEFAGVLYHVTSRGNARQDIYANDADRREFLKILSEVIARFNWLCHGYCLMTNHYHLLIETIDPNLSLGMRQLNGRYTQCFNRSYGRVGHVFQSRYKSILVEKDARLLELCRHIVLNPVAAGLVATPEQWQWGSYRATALSGQSDGVVSPDWVLAQFSQNAEQTRQQYGQFVDDRLPDRTPWGQLQGSFLGGEKFLTKMQVLLEEKAEVKEIPRQQRYAGRPALAAIFSRSKDKKERNMGICQACLDYGYTLKEGADHLTIHYTTVSKIVKKEEGKS